jgi:hypothetical protein
MVIVVELMLPLVTKYLAPVSHGQRNDSPSKDVDCNAGVREDSVRNGTTKVQWHNEGAMAQRRCSGTDKALGLTRHDR